MGRNDDGICGFVCRCLNYLISLALLGGIAAVIWHMLGRPDKEEILDGIGDAKEEISHIDFGDFAGVLDNFTISDFIDGWEEDPFAGLGEVVGPVGEGNNAAVAQWDDSSDYKGLNLELHNALDETWQDTFFIVVDEWEAGSPTPSDTTGDFVDPLKLSTKNIDVDNACSPIEGVMKVCNGNYGETGWLGINELITSVPQNIIQNSVAKMNEFYLYNADVIERQYTMCHEMGHGFGLAHTDENFFNADLGNCLDYTNFPKNNLHPDTPNFETLANLYGTVDGTWVKQSYETEGEGKGEEDDQGDVEEFNEDEGNAIRKDGGRRGRGLEQDKKQGNLRSWTSSGSTSLLTKEVRSEYAQAMNELQELHNAAISGYKAASEEQEKGSRTGDESTASSQHSRHLSAYRRLLDDSSWNLLEWHSHGSSYYKILENTPATNTVGGDSQKAQPQVYKLEVHMLHAPPKYNTMKKDATSNKLMGGV